MWNRTIMLPLVTVIGAAVIDGMLGGTRFAGLSLSAWLVVGGLSALVIAALADQARAAIAEDDTADELFSAVDRQTTLMASGLVIAGFAVLLGAFAPRGGVAFVTWAGFATVMMGAMLGVFKAIIGRRRLVRGAPWAAPRSEHREAHHRQT